MIVKNTMSAFSGSSEKVLFNLGKRQVRLAYNETAVFPDDDASIYRDARKYADDALLEIVEGPAQSMFLSPKTLPAAGWVGINTAADTNTLTIGDVVFEIDTDSSVTEGNIAVDISGDGSDAGVAAALVAAINGNADVLVKATYVGEVDTVDTVVLYHKNNNVTGSTIALAKDGAPLTVSGATLGAGTYGANMSVGVFTATATGSDSVIIATGLTAIDHFIIQVRDSSGVIVQAYAGAVTATDGVIVVANDANLTAGCTVTAIILG